MQRQKRHPTRLIIYSRKGVKVDTNRSGRGKLRFSEPGQSGRPKRNGERRMKMKTKKARLEATGGGGRRRMNSRGWRDNQQELRFLSLCPTRQGTGEGRGRQQTKSEVGGRLQQAGRRWRLMTRAMRPRVEGVGAWWWSGSAKPGWAKFLGSDRL